MNTDELFNDPEYDNFVTVYMALMFVGQILEPYTRNGLEQVHQKIQAAIGNSKCAGTCGGKEQSKWCPICKDWQKELKTYSRNQYFDWSSQESSKWPLSYEHIAGIFLNSPRGKRNVNLQDLSNQCGIWQRCKEFNLSPRKVKYVQECRGDYYAHNGIPKVDESGKAKVFDALKDLLNDAQVQTYVKQDHFNELEKIENGKYLENAISVIKREVGKINNDQKITAERLEQITERGIENSNVLEEIKRNLHIIRDRQERDNLEIRNRIDFMLGILLMIYNILTNARNTLNLYIYGCLRYSCAVICMVVTVFLVLKYLHGGDNSDLPVILSRRNTSGDMYSGCLSEYYEEHPSKESLDLHMAGDLFPRNKLIGRDWIFNLLEEKMFEPKNKSRGTLMIAEYGFGKSAIVLHLLCAQENEKGWKLRQHIVAFHVCNFKLDITKSPVQLIKRLRWFLSVKSEEYRQDVALLKNSIIDDDEKCERNIGTCFDIAIRNPLEKLIIPHDAPWIVVIDAMDECICHSGYNRILELLSDRLIHMQQEGPKWFKWIITSRYTNSLTRLNKLDILKFDFEDRRNYEDIRQFVIEYVNVSDLDIVNSFVNKSGGNILYIKHALEYIIESGNASKQNIVNLPSGIEEIYELNFKRLFEGNSDFEIAKPILELTTVKMFPTANISYILKSNKIANETEFKRIMDKLSFFVTSDTVKFRHKSLDDWVNSENNINYRISQREGHVMVSNYVFNTTDSLHLYGRIGTNGFMFFSEMLIELAYHVSKSEDIYLQIKFSELQLGRCYCYYYSSCCFPIDYFLVNAIASVDMLKLVIKLIFRNKKSIGKKRIDMSIKQLYESSVYLDRKDLVSFMHETIDNLNKVVDFPLHKAATHCSEDSARYLINKVKLSVWKRDNSGILASDIACKIGCARVLNIIAENDPSVLNMHCFIQAVLDEPYALAKIIGVFIDNGIKLNCVRDAEQKLAMMSLFPLKYIISREFLLYWSIFNKYTFIHIIRYSYFSFTDFNWIPSQIRDALIKTHILNVVRMQTGFNGELLSCPDVLGFTPALQFIVWNEYDLFSALLNKGIINDNCHAVSTGMLYMYYVFREYLGSPYRRLFIDQSCPLGASVEHLLMRHERIEVIKLVIANGYIMNWTKTDRKGMSPLDYADQVFIQKLESYFDVDIRVLSDKSSLVRLCLNDWFHFYFLLVMYCLAFSIGCLYSIKYRLLNAYLKLNDTLFSMRHNVKSLGTGAEHDETSVSIIYQRRQ